MCVGHLQSKGGKRGLAKVVYCTPYTTIYFVISQLKIPYIQVYTTYTSMVLANTRKDSCQQVNIQPSQETKHSFKIPNTPCSLPTP